jgi:CHASE2 domain-containing sensor protein
MKKQGREERRKKRAKGSVPGSHVDLSAREREAKRDIFADVAKGLILLVVLLAVKRFVFEPLPTFQRIEESVYDFLQLRLSPDKPDAKTLQVVVVDITDMKMVSAPGDRKYDFTSRDKLHDLVQQIAAEQPRAIGLDIDFTPYANQRGQDLPFLKFCRDLKRPGPVEERLPVYVGLHEAVALGPDLCLADKSFGVLAAFVGFPNVKEDESRKWIVERLKIPYEDEFGQKKIWDCPSLAAAVIQKPIKPTPPWIAWASRNLESIQGYDYSGTAFMIDYSPLEALEGNSVPWGDLDRYLNKNNFRDKYVLIGRGKLSRDTGDKFPIPGRRGNAHAGVYVHACAAYTLLNGPLIAVTDKGRILLDILLAVSVIVAVAVTRYHYRRQADRVIPQNVLAFFTFLAVMVTVGVGFFMVNVTHLMWDDFLIVAVSLLLHRWMEGKSEGFVHSLGSAWRSMVLRRPAEPVKDKRHES